MKIPVTFIALVSRVVALPGPASSFVDIADDDVYNYIYDRVFSDTNAQFQSLRTSQNRPTQYDWCSDGCTDSPDDWTSPSGQDVPLWPACSQHDFAYRNFGKFRYLNQTLKNAIDSNLKAQLEIICQPYNDCPYLGSHIPDLAYDVLHQLPVPTGYEQSCKCTKFPGCCANHASTATCNTFVYTGAGITTAVGDGSCRAQPVQDCSDGHF
jgi:hypothetical protein